MENSTDMTFPTAFGQNVIETIGFGQEADDSREGETGSIRIRLRPQPIAVDVSGQVVPLSISQYENYTFATQRTVPQSVQDAINAISDPAECEYIESDVTHLS